MTEEERTDPRKVDQQNRVALPNEVLDTLDAEAGDYVAFEITSDGVELVKVKWVPDR